MTLADALHRVPTETEEAILLHKADLDEMTSKLSLDLAVTFTLFTLTCKVPKKQTTKLHLQNFKNFQYKLYYIEKSWTRGQTL